MEVLSEFRGVGLQGCLRVEGLTVLLFVFRLGDLGLRLEGLGRGCRIDWWWTKTLHYLQHLPKSLD